MQLNWNKIQSETLKLAESFLDLICKDFILQWRQKSYAYAMNLSFTNYTYHMHTNMDKAALLSDFRFSFPTTFL